LTVQPSAAATFDEVISNIQSFVFARRVRLKEFFRDYDKQRSGRVPMSILKRGLDLAGVRLVEKEVQLLEERFRSHLPGLPQVNYLQFCDLVDEVFRDTSAWQRELMNTTGGCALQHVRPLLEKIQVLCKRKGIHLRACFTDADRPAAAPSAAPSSPNSTSQASPRRTGKVPLLEFQSLFPFREELTPDELELIVQRYRTDSGEVCYQSLHEEVAAYGQGGDEEPPFPRSDLVIKPDRTKWSQHELSAMDKLIAKVVEKRLRIDFTDFDPLRKGVCTLGQVKTAFSICGLDKDVKTTGDWEALKNGYMRLDGMFDYRKFSKDVDAAFTSPLLEKDPLIRVAMPDATSTLPARRNKIQLDPCVQSSVWKLLEKLRATMRYRRIELKPMFHDMDKNNMGHVSRTQFERVLATAGLEIPLGDLNDLCAAFCDMGNHSDINYVDFVMVIDSQAFNSPRGSPNGVECLSPKLPSKYFDDRGFVHPRLLA